MQLEDYERHIAVLDIIRKEFPHLSEPTSFSRIRVIGCGFMTDIVFEVGTNSTTLTVRDNESFVGCITYRENGLFNSPSPETPAIEYRYYDGDWFKEYFSLGNHIRNEMRSDS
jgi:hypothetical protein